MNKGYLCNLDDWSEDFALEQAKQVKIKLFVAHWELIVSYKDYNLENQTKPTLHNSLVRSLGKIKGNRFHNEKEYAKHIYKLFLIDPIHKICKLAGLPMPPPDT